MPHSGGFSGGVAFAGRGARQRSEINLVKGSAKAQKGMIEMELMEAIKGRRSVRKFKPDPIPKDYPGWPLRSFGAELAAVVFCGSN